MNKRHTVQSEILEMSFKSFGIVWNTDGYKENEGIFQGKKSKVINTDMFAEMRM